MVSCSRDATHPVRPEKVYAEKPTHCASYNELWVVVTSAYIMSILSYPILVLLSSCTYFFFWILRVFFLFFFPDSAYFALLLSLFLVSLIFFSVRIRFSFNFAVDTTTVIKSTALWPGTFPSLSTLWRVHQTIRGLCERLRSPMTDVEICGSRRFFSD